MARKMKDSGVEWIGQIPEDWEIVNIGRLFNVKAGGDAKPDLYSDIQDTEHPFPVYTNSNDKEQVYAYTSTPCFGKNTITVTGRGEIGKAFFRNTEYDAIIRLLVLQPKVDMDARFYTYWIDKVIVFFTNSAAIGQLSAQQILPYKIPILDIEIQRRIADFLDDKVGVIDAIISKTKASIEEYKKYKQAVITEVALGGLDKAVVTKKSGIDWIGNIPEHWQIKPFKFVMTERNEKNIPVKTDERLALSIDKGITTYSEKTTNLDRFKDDVTQYKLAYEGDLVFNSMNMIVGAIGYSNYFGCVSPVYYTYYDNVEGHYTSKYYEYIFRSKTMRKVLFSLGKGIMAIERGDDKINTCRLKVSRDDLRCLKVPVPTEQEQQEIVKYLDSKCAEIDALIVKKEAFVEEMEAYKKSLIYEYVTGKKEVL